MLGPTLETERLILRPPNADDLEGFVRFSADPEATRFLGGPGSPPAVWRSVAQLIGAWTLRGFSMFSFIEKETGQWVGRGGPWRPEGWPGNEIGWAITPHAQRKGYAREASIACLDYAFTTLGWDEVIHCIDPRNVASIAVAHAIGSRLLRTQVSAPPPHEDVVWDIYGQTRADWRARRHGA